MLVLFVMSSLKYDRISLYILKLTFENYIRFFSDPYFFGMVLTSLKVGFVTILVTTLGWYIILLPFGLFQRMLNFLGLIEGPLRWLHSLPALVVVLVYLHMPYVILILVASIQNVSEEKINAAKILGAPTIKVVQKVIIPLTMPGIVSSSILVFALAISSYLIPILITGQELRLLPLAIFSYTTELLNWPFASAIAIILLFIVFIATYGFIALTNRMTGRGKWEVV